MPVNHLYFIQQIVHFEGTVLAVFEQHLKIRAGTVARNKCPGRARILPKRSSPRWGEQAVLRENSQDSTI